MSQFTIPQLEQAQFQIPHWWDPHNGDPGPDWLRDRLTREDLMTISAAQIEYRKIQLEAELKYIAALENVIGKYR
jgi:hypothetical protein